MSVRRAALQDAPSIAGVHYDSWQSTYRGIVPDAFLDAMTRNARTKHFEEAIASAGTEKAIFVAEDDGGSIVGFANAGPEREGNLGFDGELYAIYLRKDAQRKGMGTMLFDAAAAFLVGQGMRGMLVWVLAANPSCGFYEARGGIEAARKTITIGGAELEEVGYGWDDIAAWFDAQ